jgi:hypothetical protein
VLIMSMTCFACMIFGLFVGANVGALFMAVVASGRDEPRLPT